MSSRAHSVTVVVGSAALLLLAASAALADVRCGTGEFAHSCPDFAPVCCFSSNGFSTGCCHAMEECNNNGDCVPGPPVPPNATATPLVAVSSIVHLSWGAVAVSVSTLVIGIVLVIAVVFCMGQLRSYFARRRAELRVQELLNAVADEDATDSDDDVAADAEVSSADEAAYRTNVLPHRAATVQHAIAAANSDLSVTQRVAAWFSRPGSHHQRGGGGGVVEGGGGSPRGSVADLASQRGSAMPGYGTNADVLDDASLPDAAGGPAGAAAAAAAAASESERAPLLGGGGDAGEQRGQAALPTADPTARYLLNDCALCSIRLANCALMPCGHCQICDGCAAHMKRCPTCKVLIRKRVKVFVS